MNSEPLFTLNLEVRSAHSHQTGLGFLLTDRNKPFSSTASGFLGSVS